MVSLDTFLLQAEPQLFQPALTGEVSQPSDHCCDPLLVSLQQVYILLVLGAQKVDTLLQVRWSGGGESSPKEFKCQNLYQDGSVFFAI